MHIPPNLTVSESPLFLLSILPKFYTVAFGKPLHATNTLSLSPFSLPLLLSEECELIARGEPGHGARRSPGAGARGGPVRQGLRPTRWALCAYCTVCIYGAVCRLAWPCAGPAPGVNRRNQSADSGRAVPALRRLSGAAPRRLPLRRQRAPPARRSPPPRARFGAFAIVTESTPPLTH